MLPRKIYVWKVLNLTMEKPSEQDFSEGLKIAFDFVETVSQTQSIYREILYLVQPESEDGLPIFVLQSLSQ